MGIKFKEFCDKARKTRNGHVPDVIDMSTEEKDAAVVAALRDDGMLTLACAYGAFSEERKNSVYQSVEWIIRDNIEKYNAAMDIIAEAEKLTPCEEEFICPSRFEDDFEREFGPGDEQPIEREPLDQEMIDAGHKAGDFC